MARPCWLFLGYVLEITYFQEIHSERSCFEIEGENFFIIYEMENIQKELGEIQKIKFHSHEFQHFFAFQKRAET